LKTDFDISKEIISTMPNRRRGDLAFLQFKKNIATILVDCGRHPQAVSPPSDKAREVGSSNAALRVHPRQEEKPCTTPPMTPKTLKRDVT
jgi:hypothetical protein